VLLPGDPGRALTVASNLLDAPRMVNTARGLWGYTGTAPDGEPVSVQSTGMGGPSAAIVVQELIELGARTLIRIGTCGSLVPDRGLGDLVTASEALAMDGASRALGAGERVAADPAITQALVAAGGGEAAPVVTSDLFYDPREQAPADWVAAGAVAVEMEAATIFQVAQRSGVRAGCLLAVSDLVGAGTRIEREQLEQLGLRLGEVALEALRTL
jgi:DeoD family purine-nucleoside phosphorylase